MRLERETVIGVYYAVSMRRSRPARTWTQAWEPNFSLKASWARSQSGNASRNRPPTYQRLFLKSSWSTFGSRTDEATRWSRYTSRAFLLIKQREIATDTETSKASPICCYSKALTWRRNGVRTGTVTSICRRTHRSSKNLSCKICSGSKWRLQAPTAKDRSSRACVSANPIPDEAPMTTAFFEIACATI